MKRIFVDDNLYDSGHTKWLPAVCKDWRHMIQGHRLARWQTRPVFALSACIFTLVLFGADFARAATVMENFEQSGDSGFPSKWRASNDDAKTIYRIEVENGNRFLRARADNQAVQIGLEQIFDARNQPRLKWRWRVHQLPTGADERVSGKHDAAAQVYVIFDNQIRPRVLKYTWSSSLPVGTQFTSPLYDRNRGIVLRSGRTEGGRWYAQEINFLEDFKKLFGVEPGKVQGIGNLTSSDATKTVAAADYDDFVLLP